MVRGKNSVRCRFRRAFYNPVKGASSTKFLTVPNIVAKAFTAIIVGVAIRNANPFSKNIRRSSVVSIAPIMSPSAVGSNRTAKRLPSWGRSPVINAAGPTLKSTPLCGVKAVYELKSDGTSRNARRVGSNSTLALAETIHTVRSSATGQLVRLTRHVHASYAVRSFSSRKRLIQKSTAQRLAGTPARKARRSDRAPSASHNSVCAPRAHLRRLARCHVEWPCESAGRINPTISNVNPFRLRAMRHDLK